MKKSIIFAALMCCIVSASAQQTKNEPKEMQSLKDRIQQVERLNCNENQFTQKLDSVTGEEVRFLYEYDSRLNCTKEMRYYPSSSSWYLDESFESTYDEFNRLTSLTHQQLSSIYRIEYTYNEQGLIKEEIYSHPSGNVWEQYNKGTYEYDEAGHVILFVVFNYNDGRNTANWPTNTRMVCSKMRCTMNSRKAIGSPVTIPNTPIMPKTFAVR